MAINREIRVNRDAFSAGGARIYRKDDRGLSAVLRGLLQKQAAVRVAAASLTALTNTGGGGRAAVGVAGSDNVTVTAHGAVVGDSVAFGGTTPPAGLAADILYYVVTVTDADNFQVSLTPGGAVIDITSAGTAALAFFIRKAVTITQADISGGTLGATAATINAAAETVLDAHRELAARANALFAQYNAGDVGEGASPNAADGTINAITVAVTANTDDDDSANYAEVRSIFETLYESEQATAEAINITRTAVAQDEAQLPGAGDSGVGGVLPSSIATAVSVTGGVTSVLKTQLDAQLVILRENVFNLATALNAAADPSTTDPLQHFVAPDEPGRGSLNVTGPSNP